MSIETLRWDPPTPRCIRPEGWRGLKQDPQIVAHGGPVDGCIRPEGWMRIETQLERQDYLADRDLVRTSALDPETCFHPGMLEGSRLFFHSFIDAALIGPEPMVIRYTIGGDRITPSQHGPLAGPCVHQINLAGAGTTTPST